MTISLHAGRRSKGWGQGGGSAPPVPSPSLREVCLVGLSRGWAAGERVTVSGRAYRVGSTQADAAAPGAGYAHLVPEPG